MNKELIKKYKKEFNWWLNGGEILVDYKNDTEHKWTYPNIKDSNDPWSFEEILIIINDKYVKFRKALAEGQTVQYYMPVKYNNEKSNWYDLKENNFYGEPTSYRIKPKKPKFKIGDWVRLKCLNKTIHKVLDLKWDKYNECYKVILENFNGNIDSEDSLELWKPQKGEWCWFSRTEYTELPQLDKMYSEYSSMYMTIRGIMYSYCEPFIGKLPNNIKEKK